MKLINARLKQARIALGLKQTDVAQLTNKSLSIIQKYEATSNTNKISDIPSSYLNFLYNQGVRMEFIFDGKLPILYKETV